MVGVDADWPPPTKGGETLILLLSAAFCGIKLPLAVWGVLAGVPLGWLLLLGVGWQAVGSDSVVLLVRVLVCCWLLVLLLWLLCACWCLTARRATAASDLLPLCVRFLLQELASYRSPEGAVFQGDAVPPLS